MECGSIHYMGGEFKPNEDQKHCIPAVYVMQTPPEACRQDCCKQMACRRPQKHVGRIAVSRWLATPDTETSIGGLSTSPHIYERETH